MSDKESSEHQHNPTQVEPKRTAMEIKGSIEIPDFDVRINKSKTEEQNDNTYEYFTYSFEQASLRINRRIAVITALYFLVTTFIFWESKRSADAAKESAETAASALKVDQRAWISFEYIFSPRPEEQTPMGAALIMKNDGKTPAKKISAEFMVQILNKDEPVAFDYSPLHETIFTSIIYPTREDGPLAIGKLDRRGNQINFSKTDVEQLMKGESYMAVYGRGTYIDVFGDTHWFHSCRWKKYFPPGLYSARGCTQYEDAGDGDLPEKKKK